MTTRLAGVGFTFNEGLERDLRVTLQGHRPAVFAEFAWHPSGDPMHIHGMRLSAFGAKTLNVGSSLLF